jgi:two-component system, cell cycle sensor histidine kinase and response regulator CckA
MCTLALLLIAGNPGDVSVLGNMLEEPGPYTTAVTQVDCMSGAEKHLAENAVDTILLDLGLPEVQGLAAVRRVRALAPHTPLIVLAALQDESLAVEALQEGAQDYLVKHQMDARGLLRAVRYAMVRKTLEESSRRDSSERERSRLELAASNRRLVESEEEYRLLFESNPHPIWVFDVETLAFLAVNDAAVRLYGFSREEFLAMTIKDIRPAEEVPGLLEYLKTIPQSPSLPATQVKHRKKDGSLLEVEGLSNPIQFHGRAARLVLANDVSEKKRLEELFLQAQKMEAVGRLAGGIAHDFNNLLGVITGFSELLLKNLGAEHPGSQRVAEILKAAERAAELTRQLLAFSRQQVMQPRVVDLGQVVADTEPMLRRLLGEDIRIRIPLGARLDLVRADPGQVAHILMNLAVNARDAMPRGGELKIETANVRLDGAYARAHPDVEPGPFVMLAVSDTGEGMSAATLARAFEPFFSTREGSGLGLSTVFGIVQQSGGSVSVESTLGEGTTFRIYFARVEGDLDGPSLADATPKGRETILLVEDADALRVMIHEVLDDDGYLVLESSDPEEALHRARSLDTPIDLLLTDVVMPRMSGPDLARSVERVRPGIKVLFMSGYTDDALGLHGVLSPDVRFIGKPFTTRALLAKVREALDESGTAARFEPTPARSPV